MSSTDEFCEKIQTASEEVILSAAESLVARMRREGEPVPRRALKAIRSGSGPG